MARQSKPRSPFSRKHGASNGLDTRRRPVMNRNIFHGMRTGRDWHEIESRANWTDLIAVVIGLVILVVGCGVFKGL